MCAVKFFRSTDGNSGRAFLDAQTLTWVTHSAVVGVYDLTEVVNQNSQVIELAIVMEYVEGSSLNAFSGTISPSLGLAIVGDMVEGVEAFHDAGIVHSDLNDKCSSYKQRRKDH